MGHAVVWGAGVAGLTAAVALAERGWSVEVRERASAVDTGGAALGIWPDVQLELGATGIWPAIGAQALPYRRAQIRDLKGRRMADLPLHRIERRWSRPVVLVRRPALMGALRDQVLRHRAISVDFRRPYERGSDEGADLVVGADGAHSRLRDEVAQVVVPAVSLGATAWRGSAPVLSELHGEVWGHHAFAGVTPCGPNSTNWYVAVDERLEVGSRDDLLGLVETWPDPIGELVRRTPAADVLAHRIVETPVLERHHRDRTVLIGDAAHAMAPSLGMGACQAILDALTLANLLVAHGEDVTAALRAYDALRRPSTTRVAARSRQLLRIQLGGAHRLRNGLARAVGALDRAPRP